MKDQKWHIRRYPVSEGIVYNVRNEQGIIVAVVPGGEMWLPTAEWESIAQLIVNVPEMLEVCNLIVQAAQEADEDENYQRLVEATEAARAVIAKVKGVQCE